MPRSITLRVIGTVKSVNFFLRYGELVIRSASYVGISQKIPKIWPNKTWCKNVRTFLYIQVTTFYDPYLPK